MQLPTLDPVHVSVAVGVGLLAVELLVVEPGWEPGVDVELHAFFG